MVDSHARSGRRVRRSVIVVVVVLLAVGAPSLPAFAATPGDAVRGNATLTSGGLVATARINARSGPAGENPTGTIVEKVDPNTLGFPAGTYALDVLCLNVDDHQAYFGTVITAAPDPTLVGQEDVILLNDGSPDTFTTYPDAAAADCSNLSALGTGFPSGTVTKGDYRIVNR